MTEENPNLTGTTWTGNTEEQSPLAAHRAVVKRPALYNVVLLNDDFTPMDFVVVILNDVFHKSQDEAIHIMWQTHHEGKGYCGCYTRDVAETKMAQVIEYARSNQFPLKCILERKE